jgi:DNA-binding transcriptional ArsR family regulator
MLSKAANPQPPHAAPIFAALGDDIRLSLVARLAGGVPLSITQLSEKLPITRQAVTKHLRVLEHAGLAKSTKTGREQMWALQGESLKEAERYLEMIAKDWESTLHRLKDFVEHQNRRR